MSCQAKLNLSTLLEFALGKLTPQQSFKIIEQLDKDREASRDLELVLAIMNFFSKEVHNKSSTQNRL